MTQEYVYHPDPKRFMLFVFLTDEEDVVHLLYIARHQHKVGRCSP